MRNWAGPLTIGTFIVTAVTGILLFFHVEVGAVKIAHEWLSLFLVVGAIAHVAVNWKPFVAYFRKPLGLGLIGFCLVLLLLSLAPLHGSGGHGSPVGGMISAMESSSVTVVAQVAKREPQAVVEELKARGLRVEGPSQTLGNIASSNGVRVMEIIACVLGQAGPASRSRH